MSKQLILEKSAKDNYKGARKLKISLLLPNRGIGGGVRSTARVGNELLSRGHSVRIFYRKRVVGLRHRLGNIYRLIRYGPSHDWLTTFKGFSAGYERLEATDFAPDELIVSMCAQTTLDTRSLPPDIGIRVLYCRGVEIENWDNMLESWKLPIPKLVTSSHLVDVIKKEVNQPVIGVVPNGVDTDEYFPCVPERERLGVGCILGSSRPKNPTDAILVMHILKHRMPDTPRYIFSSRECRKHVDAAYYRQPSVDEVRQIYSSCKVWFCTSFSEGFGNPLLEAMACGCVIVSTDCGGPRDIVHNGENGFWVGIGNTGAMVNKIELLCKDEQLRKQMSANAIKTAGQFTWPGAVDKLEGYLYSIYDKSICSNK